MSVTQLGWVRRMALTTVNPSPGLPIFKSEMRTSKGWVPIACNAWLTEPAAVTSKPCSLRIAGKEVRIAGSSSTNRILTDAAMGHLAYNQQHSAKLNPWMLLDLMHQLCLWKIANLTLERSTPCGPERNLHHCLQINGLTVL